MTLLNIPTLILAQFAGFVSFVLLAYGQLWLLRRIGRRRDYMGTSLTFIGACMAASVLFSNVVLFLVGPDVQPVLLLYGSGVLILIGGVLQFFSAGTVRASDIFQKDPTLRKTGG